MAMTLNTETEHLIGERMKRHGYPSADDTVQAALLAMDQRESLATLNDADMNLVFPSFREEIAVGLTEADAGKVSDGEAFFAELEREEREFETGKTD